MTMPRLPVRETESVQKSYTVSPQRSIDDKENVFGTTWNKMSNCLKKENPGEPAAPEEQTAQLSEKMPCQEWAPVRPPHSVIPGVPRPLTFKRQISERREKLYPHELGSDERRANSTDSRLGISCARKLSPAAISDRASSLPLAQRFQEDLASIGEQQTSLLSAAASESKEVGECRENAYEVESRCDRPHHDMSHSTQLSDSLDEVEMHQEAEAKWILNLSMHFKDNSDREKFFITYAEEPNRWRRVTVSCDYRYASSDSLEAELKSLHYQREKSERIYDAIWDSLPRIQFYSTVTNLKLETIEGRLHVHVTEDLNELVQFPAVQNVSYLDIPHFSENSIEFDTHMSGYVYKVRVDGRVYVKKEIPGPEAVDEFLYEMNALNSLKGSLSVVQLQGLIVDERGEHVKGLLLQYCEKGAFVDLIYDWKYSELMSWENRQRWARQIIGGLADIHEVGYVQGDFTLSNIVLDGENNAFIIDINRRGCPIGWDPPELSKFIDAGQRISMHIGVKSDLYQLGMVLWALAEQDDEPERQPVPLQFSHTNTIPDWYQDIVQTCLNADPRCRWSARALLAKIPSNDSILPVDLKDTSNGPSFVTSEHASHLVPLAMLSPITPDTPQDLSAILEDKTCPQISEMKPTDVQSSATSKSNAENTMTPESARSVPEDIAAKHRELPNGSNAGLTIESQMLTQDQFGSLQGDAILSTEPVGPIANSNAEKEDPVQILSEDVMDALNASANSVHRSRAEIVDPQESQALTNVTAVRPASLDPPTESSRNDCAPLSHTQELPSVPSPVDVGLNSETGSDKGDDANHSRLDGVHVPDVTNSEGYATTIPSTHFANLQMSSAGN